ncbi:GNAT family N-acetyltransferase [Micromonospora sp. STR1_7]|uniref:GNAT family N-acetyltransferase n=1 Tax=Micromonospora parastrephiae TaxID=2806101 RepID=A0ABS1XPQ5_9ACTN|nr:GNAT family N-acetyltransferase [Micromonospora parastrephiae]MBM0231228.1 GNAT family N-acetyltransferase [Micromonospora parastrephiae]
MESLDTVLAAHRAYLLGWDIGAAGGPDLPTYRSDVPHATLNGVLRVAGRTPPEALVAARQRLHGVPRIWWVGPDSDAGTADGLVSLGAAEVARLPIMTVPVGAAADAPTPAGLHIAETTDLEAFVAAYGRVSGIPADGVAATIEREKAFTGDGTVIRLAGRLDDGRIVGTAVVWLSHGLATLYFVGTQPEHRRQGIAAAMTRAALDLAAERGAHTAALTSSPVAEPVYRRLGFQPVGEFRLLTF